MKDQLTIPSGSRKASAEDMVFEPIHIRKKNLNRGWMGQEQRTSSRGSGRVRRHRKASGKIVVSDGQRTQLGKVRTCTLLGIRGQVCGGGPPRRAPLRPQVAKREQMRGPREQAGGRVLAPFSGAICTTESYF